MKGTLKWPSKPNKSEIHQHAQSLPFHLFYVIFIKQRRSDDVNKTIWSLHSQYLRKKQLWGYIHSLVILLSSSYYYFSFLLFSKSNWEKSSPNFGGWHPPHIFLSTYLEEGRVTLVVSVSDIDKLYRHVPYTDKSLDINRTQIYLNQHPTHFNKRLNASLSNFLWNWNVVVSMSSYLCCMFMSMLRSHFIFILTKWQY